MMMKAKSVVIWTGVLLVLTTSAFGWRSSLYPEDWTPGMTDHKGRFLHDFSYAGYHQGATAIPEHPPGLVFDVTKAPYGADASGARDATAAIQAAIDDAGRAGGGIVYLPAGSYNVAPQGGKDWALRVSTCGVVLRGAGPDQTFICNTDPVMRQKTVILFQPLSGDWFEPLPGSEIAAAKDFGYPGHEIRLRSTDGLTPGDMIILRSDCTKEFAAEFGMEKYWSDQLEGMVFCRKIKTVETGRKVVTVDVPTRFVQKVRDNARIYKVAPLLEECGIEALALGMVENTNPSRGYADYNKPGGWAYEVHGSHLVKFRHAQNGWIRRMRSFKPAGNQNDIHMLSNGFLVQQSRQITVRDCHLEKASYKGGGGNGYGVILRGNDCLVQDCWMSQCRHNYDMKSLGTSGNVFLRCTGRKTNLPSDFHMHMSMANLFDSMTMEEGDWLSAVYRPCGTVLHGHCTTESVFWNSRGNGGGKAGNNPQWHWDGESVVFSSQWGWGYVIGTKGKQYKVRRTEAMGSAPLDFLEGEGRGATLEPQSLYEDQLNRRLGKHGLPKLAGDVKISYPDSNPFRDALKPIPRTAVFAMDGYSLWDPSVIKVDDTYHLFCSRWKKGDWNNWKKSHVIRATSKSLFGPYEFQEVVMRPKDHPWAKQGMHNPKILKVGNQFLLYHLGIPQWSTGFLTADSIEGPWTPAPKPVLRANNPALMLREDGSAYMLSKFKCKSTKEGRALVYMRAHEAANVNGPYMMIQDSENRLPGGFELEDPTVWWANDQYNVICTDWMGKVTGEQKSVLYYTSKNGVDYTLYSQIPIWSRTEAAPMADGTGLTLTHIERPQVYVNEDGEVTALLVATKRPEDELQGVIVIRPVDHFVPANPY